MPLKIAIAGKEKGRMGAAIAGLMAHDDRFQEEALHQADVVIDFTVPDALPLWLESCADNKTPLVIGTTGHSLAQEADIHEAAKNIPILMSGNMSVGVNLLAALVEKAAQKLGDDFDIEIFEAHHRHKIDAPSGTALLLGNAAAKGRDIPLDKNKEVARDGITGARQKGAIGFSVLRSGGIIGDHDVSFGAEEEILTLSHRALDRSLFAKGALRAAQWLSTQAPGFYTMRDLLDLE